MEFSSIFNIWLFLPLAIITYYSIYYINGKNNVLSLNIVLLVLSLIFYSYGGFNSLLLIVILILINYLLGLIIEKSNNKKIILIISIVINVLVLGYFKYFAMAKEIIRILTLIGKLPFKDFLNLIIGFNTEEESIIMPIAISFITFQTISYLVDIYKEKTKAEKNIIYYYLYNLLFIKLVQGPIMNYADIGNQIKYREHSVDKFSFGIKRFCYGLGKKVIIANTLAETVDIIFSYKSDLAGSSILWFGILLYTLQIYYDFSGYSDMAIGIGGMFGFNISENFNYPYTSLSIQEFWRRWHISLGTWFKEYIYIPLGGNRKGLIRTLINLTIVFFLTGIWHGANLNFIIWGLYFAFFSVVERLFLGEWLKKNPIKILNWFYTILVVMIGWVLFRSDNLYIAGKYIINLFLFRKSRNEYNILSLMNVNSWVAVISGILFSGLIQRLFEKYVNKENTIIKTLDVVFQMLILILSIILIINGSYSPSIYGKF